MRLSQPLYRSLLLIIAVSSSVNADEIKAEVIATPQDIEAQTVVRKAADEPEPLTELPAELAELTARGVALNPEKTLFLDSKGKRLLLRTDVACENCLLEMLCCLEQTKEHESILSFRGQAVFVHAALVSLGAKPGTPVKFTPEFVPPTGQKLDIFVNWVDKDGKLNRADARTWMRHSVHRYFSRKLDKPPEGVKIPYLELRYDPYNKDILWFGPMSVKDRDHLLTLCMESGYQKAIHSFYKDSQSKPMTADFVFSGSYHFKRDEESTTEYYAAEGGFLVCVANFGQATIDIREASSASDGGQSFEAWEGKVPPMGTPVILEISASAEAPASSAKSTSK